MDIQLRRAMKSSCAFAAPVLAAFIALVVWLPGPAAAADVPAGAAFDSQGPAIDQILATIKEDAASPASSVPPAGPARAVRPIVITVSGLDWHNVGILGIKVKYLIKIWTELFPGQPHPSEKELIARMSELEPDEADPADEDALRAQEQKAQDYLAIALRDSAQKNHLDLDVIDFPWSYDPLYTNGAISNFETKLLALRDDPTTCGQPLYIVAHSWGTVLMYEALTRLQRKGQVIEVQRFVTLGSPLVPHKLWTLVFKEISDIEHHLQRRVTKPKGVRKWINLWADHDYFSNSVSAADENIRVDQDAKPFEDELKPLLKSPQHKAAKHDLSVLHNSRKWHASYWFGFQAALNSLGQTVDWDIPQKDLSLILPVQNATAALP
jgi:hypothetical protein